MALILDTGALVALDRGNRKIVALILEMREDDDAILTSSGCVAQAWRGSGPRHARLAMSLRGIDEVGLDPSNSRELGRLCGRSRVNDVVDAHVASLARQGDVIATSDSTDIGTLLEARQVQAILVHC